jgi:hypothetical protein
MNLKPLALGAAMALSVLSMPAMADDHHKHPRFTLSSPDLASSAAIFPKVIPVM